VEQYDAGTHRDPARKCRGYCRRNATLEFKMSDIKQLDDQITSLERAIVERTAQLKTAQDKWDDWRAGTLRAAIGADQINLHNLRIRRSSLAPMQEKRSPAIFIGSNF
jgi:hypothetical protein